MIVLDEISRQPCFGKLSLVVGFREKSALVSEFAIGDQYYAGQFCFFYIHVGYLVVLALELILCHPDPGFMRQLSANYRGFPRAQVRRKTILSCPSTNCYVVNADLRLFRGYPADSLKDLFVPLLD